MYTKYCTARPNPPFFPNQNSVLFRHDARIENTKPGAIPESVRMSQWMCSTSFVTVNNVVEYTSTCVGNPTVESVSSGGNTKLIVPVLPGGNQPSVVTVQNTPASVRLEQKKSELLANRSNPYNPETRFAVYFPPAPRPYICPERIPNNDTKPSTADCLPIRRFQGSAEALSNV